jgi:hypothetical protein
MGDQLLGRGLQLVPYPRLMLAVRAEPAPSERHGPGEEGNGPRWKSETRRRHTKPPNGLFRKRTFVFTAYTLVYSLRWRHEL